MELRQPPASEIEILWDIWKIRMTVSLSLLLQMVLILLGNKRKVYTSNMLRIILWLAYTAADSVATVSLSAISSNSKDYIPLWAPLILMHFGGRDTITAYSLEDNDLWHRHLLQIAVAVYVLFNTWTNRTDDFLAMALLVAGGIKMGERIWSMWNVSRDHLRESLLPPANPGPNYGGSSNVDRSQDRSIQLLEPNEVAEGESSNSINLTELDILLRAENFFDNFKPLFADLLLNFSEVKKSHSFFGRISSYTDAFKLIEAELGFSYDFFYTKAVLVHSLWGVILRFVTFSCTLFVFCAFLSITNGRSRWSSEFDDYIMVKESERAHGFDNYITYLLLVGAMVLEILAVVILLSSDWTVPWLDKHNYKQVAGFLAKRKRWSNSMAQYNLIEFSLKDRPAKWNLIQNWSPAKWNLIQNWSPYKSIKMHLFFKVTVSVPEQLKDLIFQEIQEKLSDDLSVCKGLCSRKGDLVLEKEGCLDKLERGVGLGTNLDRRILLWHIATELCYNKDLRFNSEPPNSIDKDFHCEASRLLSNYMVYIVAMCPFMLPDDIGQITLRDTCAEAIEFFKKVGPNLKQNVAYDNLYQGCTDIAPSTSEGNQSKSVLFDGAQLANNLQSLELEPHWNRARKWKLISRVWIEILCYAASHSVWTGHAQQLRRGGELLTHVWLLLAHFGITERFEVS